MTEDNKPRLRKMLRDMWLEIHPEWTDEMAEAAAIVSENSANMIRVGLDNGISGKDLSRLVLKAVWTAGSVINHIESTSDNPPKQGSDK